MTPRAVVFAATFVALNLALGKVAALLSLPVYLDTVGTILAAVLLPWRLAVLVGIGTSLLAGVIIHPAFPFYAFTQATVATLSFFFARAGWFLTWPKALASGAVLAMAGALVSAPVTVVLFGGVTLSGTTAVNAIRLGAGQNIWKAVITGSLLVESLDKLTACLLGWLVLSRLPRRLLLAGHGDAAAPTGT